MTTWTESHGPLSQPQERQSPFSGHGVSSVISLAFWCGRSRTQAFATLEASPSVDSCVTAEAVTDSPVPEVAPTHALVNEAGARRPTFLFRGRPEGVLCKHVNTCL